MTTKSKVDYYAAFRLACRFDGDICTTAQVPFAAMG